MGGNERAMPAGMRADPAAWLIALVTAAACTVLSVSRYLRLQPGSWDLGIYTEYVRQLADLHAPIVPIRQAGFNLLGDHFQPAVALLAPFFRAFPTPVTLLVAQALLTGLSVVPVCRAARALTGTGVSRAIGIAYGFSWGLQQMANFDFHEIAFAVPLLAFCLSALVRGYPRAAAWWALPLVFVKEDQGLTVAAIGVIMLGAGLRSGWNRRPAGNLLSAGSRPAGSRRAGNPLPDGNALPGGNPLPGGSTLSAGEPLTAGSTLSAGGPLTAADPVSAVDPVTVGGPVTAGSMGRGRGLPSRTGAPAAGRTWAWAGGLLIAWGLAWSALAILVIIPHFSIAHHYQYWQDGGVVGPGGRPFSLSGLLGQLAHAGTQKLRTAVMVLLPVAFLAAGSPLALAAVPSLLLRFLSTNSYYWGTGWHYNATLMPIVFLAAIDTLARLRARAGPAATAAPVAGPAVRSLPGWPRLARLVPRCAAALIVVIAGWLATREPLNGLWQPQTYTISRHVRAEEAAMARVPDSVTVEATLTMLAPLAARDDTSWVGTAGISDPRYLVFDATDSGWNPLPAASPLRFLEERHPGTTYRQIFRSDRVYVFRRTWPPGQGGR